MLCLERPRKSPKLPARRADVTAAGRARPRGFVLLLRLRLLPLLKPARRRSSSALGIPATLPHVGATSGFLLLDGYALGWAAKAAQTADTGATGCDWRFVCAINLCPQYNQHISSLPRPRPASASAGHATSSNTLTAGYVQTCIQVYFEVYCYQIFAGGAAMSAAEIENALRMASMSLEMEGQHVDAQCVKWCRRMLAGEITLEEYLALVIKRAEG